MTPPTRPEPHTMTREQMRAANAAALARIRDGEPQPYAEQSYVLRVVHARGRRSGRHRAFPIAVTQIDGRRYLCAPTRTRDWVRNLLADGRCRVESDPNADQHAVPVDGDEAAQAIAVYLGKIQRPTSQWPFRQDAPIAEIREYLPQVAVFRLDPAPH